MEYNATGSIILGRTRVLVLLGCLVILHTGNAVRAAHLGTVSRSTGLTRDTGIRRVWAGSASVDL